MTVNRPNMFSGIPNERSVGTISVLCTLPQMADALADAVTHGPFAALRTARSLTDQELRLGLDFVSVVLEVASGSARAMAAVLAERLDEEKRQGMH